MLFATDPPSHASVSSLQDQEQYGKDFLLAVDISKSLCVCVLLFVVLLTHTEKWDLTLPFGKCTL
jgi:hypothetical protein